MVRIAQALLVLLIAFAALAGPAQAAPANVGDLDTGWAGYGAGGQVLSDFPGNLEAAYPYGDKIIALGGDGSDFVVALYTADGQLDPAFGSGGVATVDFGVGADSATAVRPYGGQFFVVGAAGGDFGLVKLNADGSPDTSFGGGDGQVTVDFNGKPDWPVAVLLRGDGKLLLAGSATEATAQNCFIVLCERNLALARVDFFTGALDTTFDGDGKAQTDLGPDEYALAAVYSGAGIVVAGATCQQFSCQYLIAGYTLAGAPDAGFDGDGIRTDSLAQAISALRVDPGGQIMAAGPTASGYALMRLNANGSPEAAFGGGDGLVTSNWGASDLPRAVIRQFDGEWLVGGATDGNRFAFTRFSDLGEHYYFLDAGPYAQAAFSGGSSAALSSLVELPDGRLWGLGRVSAGGQSRLALTRHFASGLPDAGGWQLTHSDSDDWLRAEEGRAAVFQPDGKLIVAGTFTPGGSSDGGIGLVRYTADGDLDPSFDGDGIVYLDLADSAAVYDVALQPDGKILVAGYVEYTENDETVQDFLAARFDANGAPDAGFGSGGVAIHDLGPADKAYALAVQPDGKVILAGETVWPGIQPPEPGLVVLRLGPGGELDSGFGNGGYSGSAGPDLHGFALALQPDGKIVVAGTILGDFIVIRFTSTGWPDSAFNGSGAAYTNFGGYDAIRAVVVQPDGAILAFGDDGQSALFARYTPEGAPDNFFDSDGKLIYPDGASEAHAMVLQGTTILAVGCEYGVEQRLTSLYRLNADGTPVMSGQPFQDYALGWNVCAYDLALGPGRIALAGAAVNYAADFGVAMLQANYIVYLPLVLK